MKRVISGGFLLISGVNGLGFILESAVSNLTDGWNTPPGRLATTILENGTLIPAVVFLALLVLGLYILGMEYFKE